MTRRISIFLVRFTFHFTANQYGHCEILWVGKDIGYPHDGRADKDSYPHDGRADKDSYPHDR